MKERYMNSDDPSTDYVESAEITSNYLVTIPDKVQKIIFSGVVDEREKIFHWYIHELEDNEYVYLANHSPREENSYLVETTESHSSPRNRTSIPSEIRNKKHMEQGDRIYFHAHDEAEESKNPSVAVLTESQLSSKIDLGIQSDSDNSLHSHRTYTTPSINDDGDENIDNLLDEIINDS